MVIATALLAVLVCGSLVYCVLIVLASWRYRKADLETASGIGLMPPMSILKPLCGHDEGLEENIRSFMEQDYPRFEVIFSVHRNDDSAAGVAQRIISEYAGRVKARLMVTGDSPIPNAKAFSLNRLVREAEHELLVMSDSDVRVDRNLLRHLAAEFQERGAGLITCPYRAIAGKSVWSRLEAVGMNTELLGGVLVARMLEGMKFALGCTVAVRKSVLESMGGFAYLQDFLAEDFVIGQRAAELGQVVLLSSYIIEHRIGSQGVKRNLSHRLRWARSTRRSRPLGYWGQIFTYPLPWALLLWAFNSAAWPIVVLTLVLRSAAAVATAVYALGERSAGRELFLLPLQDLLGVIVWMGGFLGDTIVWRDRKCTVLRDGRLQVHPQS